MTPFRLEGDGSCGACGGLGEVEVVWEAPGRSWEETTAGVRMEACPQCGGTGLNIQMEGTDEAGG